MKQIIIRTQKEFDKIKKVEKDEEVIIESRLKLNCILSVYGILRIQAGLDCSFSDLEYVVAWGNSSVVARGNSSVVARGNSSVEAWESSSVVARESSSVEAWENVFVRAFSFLTLSLHGFSVLSIPFDLKLKFKKEKTCLVQRTKPQKYLDREGIPIQKGKVILFKRVSKNYKTQEGTDHETLWLIGSIVTHLAWNPKKTECGEGKFHACSKPYFCDEFRSVKDDKYIAVEIATKNLYEWKNPQYTHKIAFREGKVLYEVDKHGKKMNL